MRCGWREGEAGDDVYGKFRGEEVQFLKRAQGSSCNQREETVLIVIKTTDNRLEQAEYMPKVDVVKDAGRLKSTDVVYMKRLEEHNLERAKRVQIYRKRNRISGIVLGLTALSIYVYTMYAVKQEKFLDDFEVPQKTIEKTA
ncbi:hypothetical protein DMN91_006840 [Ooceraea biroi]|uniref:Cytochrome c oxidase assembly factor 3 n=2 Tax=Ooceraea biroi TaxID=2015173 RepID=A0A3L8DJ81_OOCBI|nr:hypothetical protein DMN91_006840 [Ooceraea biroi]